MTRKPVNSSSIASIGYQPETLIMEVEFRHFRDKPPGTPNSIYQYRNVGKDIHQEIMGADSIGSAVNKILVKDSQKFPFKKVE